VEAEGVRAENSAQATYEMFAKKTTEAMNAKTKELNDKMVQKANFEQALTVATQSKEATEGELKGLATSLKELHDSCDFLIKNFDMREDARDAEMDSLKNAKAILSGAQTGLIQEGDDSDW